MKKDIMAEMLAPERKMSKSHRVIAAYISQNCEQAVFMTAAKLGSTVGVSESTVVRFAIGLGFEGYPEFQKELENWIKSKLGNVQRMGYKYSKSSQSELISSVLMSDIENIQNTLELIDTSAFEAAVRIILEARCVYIVGLRSCEPLADFLAFYLHMIRDNIELVRSTSTTEVFEQMIRINERDVVIGISFPRYSMRTLKAMEFANDRNASVIAITDNEHSPMKLYSSCNLFAKTDSVSIVDSLVAPLSLMNALVVALCLKCPDEVRNNLKNLEQTWNSYQVYLNDEIDFIGEDPVLNYSLKKEESDE